jgi:NADH-ubiquinone oxidoreductase chain 2
LNIIFRSALLIKIGAAPFHFWFPEIIEGMSWNNTLILLTWQKIAPITIFIYIKPALIFLLSIIIWSIIIRGIFGLNQISIRKILVYSSINHIGWIILPIAYNEIVWFYYIIIYIIINFNIIIILKIINISNLNQINIINKKLNIKILFILNFLSLGGIPPLIGFIPKWITIQIIIQNNLFLLSLIIIIITIITLYFYTRITLSTLTLTTEENFWIKKKLRSFIIIFLNIITISSLFLCTLSFNFL